MENLCIVKKKLTIVWQMPPSHIPPFFCCFVSPPQRIGHLLIWQLGMIKNPFSAHQVLPEYFVLCRYFCPLDKDAQDKAYGYINNLLLFIFIVFRCGIVAIYRVRLVLVLFWF